MLKEVSKKAYDVVIIGGGVVGYSAAIYCGRLKLKTIVIEKEIGGNLAKIDDIENYPGFQKISGINLVNKIKNHAKNYEVEFYNGEVVKVSKTKNCISVKTKKNDYLAKTIIFCTGSKVRKLEIPGEKEFEGKGVHYCALCDGPLYKNKVLAVAGGGDSAAKEALLLSKYAKKIYMIARNKLKPNPINDERIKQNKKIQIIEDNQIQEIKGDKFVKEIVLKNKLNNSNTLNIDGIFVYIGHIPLSDLAVELGVKINKNKEIITDKESKTNIEGIYAAGDVSEGKFKQAITGVGEAVKAVYSAYEYITKKGINFRCTIEH
ncbi:MAG: FAD-dependent oxidoreductase [Nanoarchaeota archaeon]